MEILPTIGRTFGIIKALDLMPYQLCDHLGVRKVALSYTIWDVVDSGNVSDPASKSVTSNGYYSIIE